MLSFMLGVIHFHGLLERTGEGNKDEVLILFTVYFYLLKLF